MAKKNPRLGFDFEEAVYRFAATLDPQAEVLFNHSVPDRDTGAPRQCDVWVSAKFGGHWPLSILVSCKDHKRKLHSGDIGTFRDEVRSVGASTGVIYSRAGFTKPALLKAQASGYPCCRIYRNEPADIPASVCFEQFACSLQIQLKLMTDLRGSELKTWHDVFVAGDAGDTILDGISAVVRDNEDKAVREASSTASFPPDWSIERKFIIDESSASITLQVVGRWKKYHARLEATLLDGSYSLSNDSFSGTQYGPMIDRHGEHPGGAWTEISDSDLALPSNRVIAILYHGKVKDILQEKLGPSSLYQ